MVRLLSFLLIAFIGLSPSAFADDARPLHIEINEVGEHIKRRRVIRCSADFTELGVGRKPATAAALLLC